jgi:hypothetical protein
VLVVVTGSELSVLERNEEAEMRKPFDQINKSTLSLRRIKYLATCRSIKK